MDVEGHSAEKYITGRRLRTSVDRRWSGILAESWSHVAGELASVVPRDTEIAFLIKGQTLVERRAAGQRQRTHARPGTIWLCPAGIREEYIRADYAAEECLHIFLPGNPFADTLLKDFDVDPAGFTLRYEAVPQDPLIGAIAQQIYRELSSETSAGALLMETLGRSLSAYLVRQYSDAGLNIKTSEPKFKPLDPRRMTRVLAYIEAELEGDFTVANLADVACMSPAHFARSFKAATGVAPHAFVSRERLERAKEMLTKEDRDLADIAYAAGFSSQSNFNRAFKKAVGRTPSQYRSRDRRNCADSE